MESLFGYKVIKRLVARDWECPPGNRPFGTLSEHYELHQVVLLLSEAQTGSGSESADSHASVSARDKPEASGHPSGTHAGKESNTHACFSSLTANRNCEAARRICYFLSHS